MAGYLGKPRQAVGAHRMRPSTRPRRGRMIPGAPQMTLGLG
nr:MAG TPA: hypothetical protein [Caudoviricetes sp.]